eukprot:scaffold31174_cov56-Phaeocystis_antarctica.AAC.1
MVLTLALPLTFESAVSFVCMQLPRPSPSPGSASSVISCIVRLAEDRSRRECERVGLVGSGSGEKGAQWPCGVVSRLVGWCRTEPPCLSRDTCRIFHRDRATDAKLTDLKTGRVTLQCGHRNCESRLPV